MLLLTGVSKDFFHVMIKHTKASLCDDLSVLRDSLRIAHARLNLFTRGRRIQGRLSAGRYVVRIVVDSDLHMLYGTRTPVSPFRRVDYHLNVRVYPTFLSHLIRRISGVASVGANGPFLYLYDRVVEEDENSVTIIGSRMLVRYLLRLSFVRRSVHPWLIVN